jgi:uroporphyrinogen III methyltransferase/synthase
MSEAGPGYTEPRVALVGAGPGNPTLLTLRAVEWLRRAEVVIHDQLLPSAVLEHAAAAARRICVNELHPCHAERAPRVIDLVLEAAREGKCVVRLKGGDPFIFGRGGEEGEALHQAGVPFEVVPGVTAALGAAAFAGIPLTHRGLASAVALVTGHETPGKAGNSVDWAALARFPGTLVIYMGLARLAEVVSRLLEHGLSPEVPAATVSRATTGRQQTVQARLADLPRVVREADLAAPAVTIIGPVVGLRRQLAWFERRPLLGRHVVVTRPRQQAGDLVRRLEDLGATVSLLPAVEIRDPTDWGPVDAALARLASFQWLVFTSANGVHHFLKRLRQTGRDLRALGGLKLAVIGPATAEALRGYHLEPDLLPGEFRSEALAAALAERVQGQRVLLARADRGRELLREQLAAVAEVEQVAAYSQVDAPEPDLQVVDAIRRGAVDFVLLTSSNIARAVVRLVGPEGEAQLREGRPGLVTISPVTSADVRALGLPVAAEARTYTAQGVVEALLSLVGS